VDAARRCADRQPPPNVRAKIAEMRPVLTPELVRTTIEMVKPLAAAKSLDGSKIDAEVSYSRVPTRPTSTTSIKCSTRRPPRP
jgi:hypothetical protein